MSDVANWVKQQGGEAKIFSMHGLDVNFELDELDNPHALVAKRVRPDDPFLPDRLNLQLANSTLHYYPRTAASKPPSHLQLAVRAVQLSVHFAPIWTTSWLALLSRKFRNNAWYPWMARCLARSGPAFIKWGQWAATRTDMFPIELCQALENLHADAPAHSWEFTQRQVEHSLDIPPGSLLKVFSSFDPEPMASGSIAQVHKAQLLDGRVVAAKVRHPKVAERIDMDFRLMGCLAGWCDLWPALRWLHIKDSVSQFSHTMAAQAHLHVEAHHLEVLNHNFRSFEGVRFPKPIFASNALILETFESGRIVTTVLDEFDEQAIGTGFRGFELIPVSEAKFLVANGVSMYLKMLMVDNLMVGFAPCQVF